MLPTLLLVFIPEVEGTSDITTAPIGFRESSGVCSSRTRLPASRLAPIGIRPHNSVAPANRAENFAFLFFFLILSLASSRRHCIPAKIIMTNYAPSFVALNRELLVRLTSKRTSTRYRFSIVRSTPAPSLLTNEHFTTRFDYF